MLRFENQGIDDRNTADMTSSAPKICRVGDQELRELGNEKGFYDKVMKNNLVLNLMEKCKIFTGDSQ